MNCTSVQVSVSLPPPRPQAGMPVSLMPFSMIQYSSPSVSSWVSLRRISGARGYRFSPNSVRPLPSFA